MDTVIQVLDAVTQAAMAGPREGMCDDAQSRVSGLLTRAKAGDREAFGVHFPPA